MQEADEDNNEEIKYEAVGPSPLDSLIHSETRDAVAGVPDLTQRERTLIRMRYEDGMSDTEVAALVGVTRGRVSQIIGAAKEKIERDPRIQEVYGAHCQHPLRPRRYNRISW